MPFSSAKYPKEEKSSSCLLLLCIAIVIIQFYYASNRFPAHIWQIFLKREGLIDVNSKKSITSWSGDINFIYRPVIILQFVNNWLQLLTFRNCCIYSLSLLHQLVSSEDSHFMFSERMYFSPPSHEYSIHWVQLNIETFIRNPELLISDSKAVFARSWIMYANRSPYEQIVNS